jgi:hypothetical protein
MTRYRVGRYGSPCRFDRHGGRGEIKSIDRIDTGNPKQYDRLRVKAVSLADLSDEEIQSRTSLALYRMRQADTRDALPGTSEDT